MYPKPDRSDFKPNRRKTADNDSLDIGWNEGVLSDGRPFRLEAWCRDQMTFSTYLLSVIELENASALELADLLEREKLLQFNSPEERALEVRQVTNSSGNALWSITVIVGDDEGTLLQDYVPLKPYPNE